MIKENHLAMGKCLRTVQERPLGRSGIHVPVVGMGTWKTFDVAGAERNARRRLVQYALDLGGNLFDSSPF